MKKSHRDAALICAVAASSVQWAGDIRYADIAADLGASFGALKVATAARRTARDHGGLFGNCGRYHHAEAEAVIMCGQICPRCSSDVGAP